MRVLIAPDKFKGSLTAAEAGDALRAGWIDGWPGPAGMLEVRVLPIADGGEGTAQAIHDALGGKWVAVTVSDPLGRPAPASYVLVEHRGERLAVLEMSSASGYLLVNAGERDLLRTNTFGTGELLSHAANHEGVSRMIIGIGGSATNDGGIGLASALGYRFSDTGGRFLAPYPANMGRLGRIEIPAARFDVPVTVACDVVNPLLGPNGATQVYGPQKGLRSAQEAALLEAGLFRLAEVAAKTFGRDCRHVPGAGAAGGLGFGLMTFCQAELRSGFELVADLLDLPAAVSWADIVLTGEGSLDSQTLQGKGPAGVAAMARRFGKPVVAFGGRAEASAREGLAACFDHFITLTDAEPLLTQKECMERAGELLRRHARQLASQTCQAAAHGDSLLQT